MCLNIKNLLIMTFIAIAMIGCGNDEWKETEPATGHVRAYNVNNASNRVNIFVTMGQSNSVGIKSDANETVANVFMPVEKINNYPENITFKEFNTNDINRADYKNQSFINTATKVAKYYNSATPLYIINIARSGIGINTGWRETDHWNPYRIDNDGNGLHPQAIHYIEKVITELQNKGLEPYVVGIDWNQWEAENHELHINDYIDNYKVIINTFETVMPNKDYKFFICKPVSLYFKHTAKIADAFKQLESIKSNIIIYDPLVLNSDIWRDAIKAHYTENTFDKFAYFILNNMKL